MIQNWDSSRGLIYYGVKLDRYWPFEQGEAILVLRMDILVA